MQLFFQENIPESDFELDPEESRHLAKVLRKSVGDWVYLTNGKGSFYTCAIQEINLKKTVVKVIEQKHVPPEKHHIHLAIAPTKNADRIEWMVEKITEIGFQEITFMQTENTERNHLRLDRIQKKIIAACKQSLQTWLPLCNGVRSIKDILVDPGFSTYEKFIAYVDKEGRAHLFDQVNPNNSYLILIGPEGDFSPAEIDTALQNGFKACSLGKNRLRTETAGIVAVHTLHLSQNKP